ncbi:hypothetical protein EJ05DRAFT_474557, partial [Pseudovirgaria hyperparasitica]
MARLNEPPGNSESVEVVKRRFLRQNRELAKCNSNQSVRIRSLEQEISRLLAENLSLREQIIQSQSQLEHYEQGPTIGHLAATRNLLEAKMRELGQIVAGLGSLPTRAPRAKPQPVAAKKSPDERNWRNALLQSEECLLPTIMEDKYHPRRTLDAEDIKGLFINGTMESPDLGPPPVAHFQDEDPIKCDLPVTNRRVSALEDGDDVQDMADILPANLETRRRRRDSSSRRKSMFEPSIDDRDSSEAGSVSESNDPPRTGSKRKLSAREDDGTAVQGIATNDDSHYIRKTSAEPVIDTAPPPNPQQTRKILGAKSTNSTSPKKQVVTGKKDGRLAKDVKRHVRVPPKGNENHEPISINGSGITEAPVLEIVDIALDTIHLPPKTPVGVGEIFSPASTEASTERPDRRDGTPPPADLDGTSIDQQLNGRGSRRSRPAVSYAEPKLNVKMRRPGKELVDAVITKEPRPTTSVVKPEDAPSAPVTVEKPSMRTVVIKREREDDRHDWEGLPQSAPEQRSPLSNKTTSAPPLPDSEKTESNPIKPTGAAATISALISNSTKPKQQPKPNSSKDDRNTPKDELAVFDFTESSPATLTDKPELPKSRVESARARTARRHSSVAGLVSKSETVGGTRTATSSSSAAKPPPADSNPKKTHTVSRDTKSAVLERAASRRRSMM